MKSILADVSLLFAFRPLVKVTRICHRKTWLVLPILNSLGYAVYAKLGGGLYLYFWRLKPLYMS